MQLDLRIAYDNKMQVDLRTYKNHESLFRILSLL